MSFIYFFCYANKPYILSVLVALFQASGLGSYVSFAAVYMPDIGFTTLLFLTAIILIKVCQVRPLIYILIFILVILKVVIIISKYLMVNVCWRFWPITNLGANHSNLAQQNISQKMSAEDVWYVLVQYNGIGIDFCFRNEFKWIIQ